jgi:hypothetical protein
MAKLPFGFWGDENAKAFPVADADAGASTAPLGKPAAGDTRGVRLAGNANPCSSGVLGDAIATNAEVEAAAEAAEGEHERAAVVGKNWSSWR